MRILIAGGGVAGLTLAAKLAQQGRRPVVVEQSSEYGDDGYGISLYPLGSCVFHGLGLYDELTARAEPCRRYEIADHAGKALQSVDMSELTDNVGPMFTLSRRDLIDVLRKACGDLPIRMGTRIESIDQAGGAVEVGFSDNTTGQFDLVVGCDGIHSSVRKLILGEQEVFDTGWTIWTWWGRPGLIPSDLVREYWGRECFFGVYPAPGRCMFGAGLPTEAIQQPHASEEVVRPVLASVFSELLEKVPEARLAFDDAQTVFGWPMTDVRAREWYCGRVALCGDAGAAFLPTAGVGASSA
ncbi:MAG: FAD-dependent oxidoreductase, partial [Bryobacteraceae bacterium]